MANKTNGQQFKKISTFGFSFGIQPNAEFENAVSVIHCLKNNCYIELGLKVNCIFGVGGNKDS